MDDPRSVEDIFDRINANLDALNRLLAETPPTPRDTLATASRWALAVAALTVVLLALSVIL